MANNWDAMYQGTPPWDIGRPQPAIVRLAEAGQIRGLVLDIGCGTGENLLYLAEHGYQTVGIDGAPRAIDRARAKARQRGLDTTFQVADALALPVPAQLFDTVIDSGLFHVFGDDERVRFSESLRGVLQPGGTYFMMCFSEHEPGDWGPRRVTQAEIRSTFAAGWRINDIQPSAFETNVGPVQAWLSSISKA